MKHLIILEVESVLKDEYINTIHSLKQYFFNLYKGFEEDKDIIKIYNNIPDNFKSYCDIWKSLKIWNCFNCFSIKENILKIKLTKSESRHYGLLENDYNIFVKEIIEPISSSIIKCKISHDGVNKNPTILTNEDLKKAKYINAYIISQEIIPVQYGKRLQIQPKKQRDIDISFISIYPNIYESEPESWPKSLEKWWDKLSYNSVSKDEVIKISNDLKKYYDEDEELLKIADWLDDMCKINNIKFHFSYKKGVDN